MRIHYVETKHPWGKTICYRISASQVTRDSTKVTCKRCVERLAKRIEKQLRGHCPTCEGKGWLQGWDGEMLCVICDGSGLV